ncbi:MAG: hypothetical protein IPL32_01945 [Chloracidobacterium sp.]|nr:hypothetical protein [Chloracidobacterium sp.]
MSQELQAIEKEKLELIKKVEDYKAIQDYLKHMTTLSAGSIVIIATFLEKIIQNPTEKWLVIISLGAFLLSILSSMIVYTIAIVDDPLSGDDMSLSTALGVIASLSLTCIGFFVGILSLAIFAIVNLYPSS